MTLQYDTDLYIDPRDFNGGNSGDPGTLTAAMQAALSEDLPLLIFDRLYVHGKMDKNDSEYVLPEGQSLTIRGVNGGGIKRQDNSIPAGAHTDTYMFRLFAAAAAPSGLAESEPGHVIHTTGSVKFQNVIFDLNWRGQTDAIAGLMGGDPLSTIEQDAVFNIRSEAFEDETNYAGQIVHVVFQSIEMTGCTVRDRWHSDVLKTLSHTREWTKDIGCRVVVLRDCVEDYSWAALGPATSENGFMGIRKRAFLAVFNQPPRTIALRNDVYRFEQESTPQYRQTVGRDGDFSRMWIEDLTAQELDLTSNQADGLFFLTRCTTPRFQSSRSGGWAKDCDFTLPDDVYMPLSIGYNPADDVTGPGMTFEDCTFTMVRNRQIRTRPGAAWETKIHFVRCHFQQIDGDTSPQNTALIRTEEVPEGAAQHVTASWEGCTWEHVSGTHIACLAPGTYAIDASELPDGAIALSYENPALAATVTITGNRPGAPEVMVLAGAGLTLITDDV